MAATSSRRDCTGAGRETFRNAETQRKPPTSLCLGRGASAPQDPSTVSRLSTAFHNYGDVSAADASRLAALLVGRILPVCSLLAPCDPGASAPEYVTVIVERSTKGTSPVRSCVST